VVLGNSDVVRYELIRRPVWVRSVLCGVVFALFQLLTVRGNPLPTLLGALVGGLLFGSLFTLFLRRQDRRIWGDEPMTGDEKVAAVQAVDRGAPPAEPGIRAAATRLAELRTASSNRPGLIVALFGGLLVIMLAAAIYDGGAMWWTLAAVLAVFTPWVAITTARQRAGARRFLAAVEGP
jgi:hypothetical protein